MVQEYTNVDKWSRWFGLMGDDPRPQLFGDDVTYRTGAEWLAECSLVQDWGCGKGGLRHFIEPQRYWGIDGSATPFADEIADLAAYRSQTPGLFMRHVLEHDYRWRDILDNAVASFTERMVLVIFTPLQKVTGELAFNPDPGVPDLGFAKRDITDRFGDAVWKAKTVETQTQYGSETSFYLRHKKGTAA
jgi:hypothetical protein